MDKELKSQQYRAIRWLNSTSRFNILVTCLLDTLLTDVYVTHLVPEKTKSILVVYM
jgi:hypothetical protein